MFVLPNLGTAVHEFQVGPAGLVASDTVDGIIVVEVDEIDGGHVKTVTYTFDGPGRTRSHVTSPAITRRA